MSNASKSLILILSNKWDISVDFVVRLLRKKDKHFLRINTEDIHRESLSINLPHFSHILYKKGLTYELMKELQSVWYRRPVKPFEFAMEESKPEEPVLQFIADQWFVWLESLTLVDDVRWINRPTKNREAENKIGQLKIAETIGFRVPKTCITNSKKILQKFFDECGGKIVAKALHTPLIEYRDKDYFIFTTQLTDFESMHEEELQISPAIFQQLLTEKTDYRVTVVDDECFVVRIDGKNGREVPIDWRTEKEGLNFVPCDLPDDLRNKCVKIVRQLGLVFGAIDLVESKNAFYFLEINPNGEWGWLEKQAGLPISEAIVEYLSHRT